MTKAENAEDIDSFDRLATESMVDIAYTYKTFFKMARWSYTISTIMNVIMIFAAVGLFESLRRQLFTAETHTMVAGGLAILAVFDQAINFDKKGNRYEQTGDAYDSLYKDFREYRRVTLPNDEISIDQKRDQLNHLIERQQELNELTPSTWDLAYARLDDDDVLGNIEVTDEERERI